MIATRTPFRVTLGGGGTDLPNFYREHGGFIFAMAIDKYMYVMLNPRPIDRKVRLLYSISEIADSVEEIRHELAREALKLHGIHSAIEIASLADLPAGTGMGSSSSYLVGLLTAIRAYRRTPCSLQELAEEACHIELEILKKPIGKQDQYVAAFGGMSILKIDREGRVAVERVTLKTGDLMTFIANTQIYYTGHQRNALDILSEQSSLLGEHKSANYSKLVDSLKNIKELGYRSLEVICKSNFDEYGQLLHQHWLHKKALSPKVSIPGIDEIYETVRKRFGVLGGKLIGAGGGGFLLLYAPTHHAELTQFMEKTGLPRLWYGLDFEGANVMAHMTSHLHMETDHGIPSSKISIHKSFDLKERY